MAVECTEICRVLNEQVTGYKYLRSIKLKNGARHLKEYPYIASLPNLRVTGLNAKAWYTFQNRKNKRATYGYLNAILIN